MKSPYVWFGGKRKVATQVWKALGDVDNYVEPFFGSGAVLLGRPHDLDGNSRRTETINDVDGFVSNFWRAVSLDPVAVAHYADYPVNETDLFARHLWLVNEGRSRLLEGMESDPEWYDAKVAGWWVWGVNAWIGSGWCTGKGPWTRTEDGIRQLPHLGNAGQGVNRKLPHLGNAGRGVNRQLPHLGSAGQGVNRQLPHLGSAGQGVNRQLPHLGDAGRAGFNNLEYRRDGIAAYFVQLANRLRDTRVCNGDWTRVVTSGALSFGATVGVFLDPPYLGDVRTADLYAVDDHHIAHDVRAWCLTNGDDKRLRIVLAGYTDEHDHLMPDTWRRIYWSSSAAYQTTNSAERFLKGKEGGNLTNRHKECLWLSPSCVDVTNGRQLELFADQLQNVTCPDPREARRG